MQTSNKTKKQKDKVIKDAIKLVSKDKLKIFDAEKAQFITDDTLPRHGRLIIPSFKQKQNNKIINGFIFMKLCNTLCLVGHTLNDKLKVNDEFMNSGPGHGFFRVNSDKTRIFSKEIVEMLNKSESGRQMIFLLKNKYFSIISPLHIFFVDICYTPVDKVAICTFCYENDVYNRNWKPCAYKAQLDLYNAASKRVNWKDFSSKHSFLGRKNISIQNFIKETKILDDVCFSCRTKFWEELDADYLNSLCLAFPEHS